MTREQPIGYDDYDYYKYISTKLQNTLKTIFALVTALIALLALFSRSRSIKVGPLTILSNTFVQWGILLIIISIVSNTIAQVGFKPPKSSTEAEEYTPALKSLMPKTTILRTDVEIMDNYAKLSIFFLSLAIVLLLSGLGQIGAVNAGYIVSDVVIWTLVLFSIGIFVLLPFEIVELLPKTMISIVATKKYVSLQIRAAQANPSLGYKKIDWMNIMDWRILLEIDSEEQPMKPDSLKRHVGSNAKRIQHRCEILSNRNLLNECSMASYETTPKGSDFVKGFIKPQEL